MTDSGRRWESIVERSRSRVAARSRALPPIVADAVEQAFDTCESLVKELAASQAEVAELKRTLAGLANEWAQLFAAMPVPCILTDATGTVVQSNQAAAGLLNVSSRHLESRVITYFIEERSRFLAALNNLSCADDRFSGSFLVRPRERAPLKADVIAVRCTTGHQSGWLWFFTRLEDQPRGRDRTRAPRRSAPPQRQRPMDATPADPDGRGEEQTAE